MGHEQVRPVDVRPWPGLNGLLDELLAVRRQTASAQAAEARLFAHAVELVAERLEERRRECTTTEEYLRKGGTDLPLREISLELGMAMRMSDRTVQARMGQAWTLVQQFPATLAAWETGAIEAGHVWAIVHSGTGIADDDRRARYEQFALDAAATESPHRFATVARAIAGTVDPETSADLIAHAHAERRVRVFPLADGLARLVADLPAPLAYAIHDRLTQLARSSEQDASPDAGSRAPIDQDPAPDDHDPAPDTAERVRQQRVVTGPGPGRSEASGTDSPDTRTTDQRRADAFAEILLTAPAVSHGDGAGAVSGRVQVTIPILTLAEVGDEPALLTGYGPIDPRIARQLAAAAPGWDRVYTDAYTGLPLAVDRYRPHAQLVRYLETRDERCRTPGCSVPAHRCDKDHTVDAALGGATEAGNLADFCRRHHVGKHHTAWRVRQLGGGVLEWTGPSGRRYRDRPPATVRFVPQPDDEPDRDLVRTRCPIDRSHRSSAAAPR